VKETFGDYLVEITSTQKGALNTKDQALNLEIKSEDYLVTSIQRFVLK